MRDLICVKSYGDRFMADIAKGLLEANGIKAILRADDEGRMAPFLGGVAIIYLYVSKQDAYKACSLLADEQPKQFVTPQQRKKQGTT